MKYCSNCGNELLDEAVVCVKCGSLTENYEKTEEKEESSTLVTATKVLMIISTVIIGFYILPLAWCIPMTVSYFNKIKNKKPIETGFKVCTLIFVSTISGILMLVDDKH